MANQANKSRLLLIIPLVAIALAMLITGGIALGSEPAGAPASINAAPLQATATPTSQPATETPAATHTSVLPTITVPEVTITVPVPSITVLATHTATATATETPGTPTATPTACTLQFRDVPPSSIFYRWIHCLVCLGIVNGYPDGTFRPNALVTRGQLSKIVANSAHFPEIPHGHQFQDVPPAGPGSTFYEYIYRLVNRGYINGYPCGAPPAGPCKPPDNLPYFRPNASATRGQISKIVSNAAGFTDTPTGQQFQDVPPAGPGSTFYVYIYRLSIRNIINGYPCGSPVEPCVPPRNLPYFRPNANATRGQMSKIDDGGFFPDCNPRLQ